MKMVSSSNLEGSKPSRTTEKDVEIETTRENEKKKAEMKSKRKAMYKMLRSEMKLEMGNMIVGCICLLGSTASNAAVPKAFSRLIDRSTASPSSNSTVQKPNSDMMYLSLIVIGGGVCSFLRTTSLKRAEYNIASRLSQSSFSSLLLNKPLSFVQQQEHNDEKADEQGGKISVKTILTSDVETVSKTITLKIAHLIRSLSSCTYSTITMVKLNAALFLLSASVIPILGITAVTLSKWIKRYNTKLLEVQSDQRDFVEERLDHLYTVKSCNRANDEIETYRKLQSSAASLKTKVALAEGFMMGGMFAGTVASILAVVNSGGKAVKDGKMTTGGLMGFATYSFLLGMGTSGVMKSMGEIRLGMTSALRVHELMSVDADDSGSKADKSKNSPDASVLPSHSRKPPSVIQFQNVSFSYCCNRNNNSPSDLVLKDINLNIHNTDIIAIVGKNGAGKSTLAKLLSGIYSPSSGSIKLNDIPLQQYTREEQSRYIGIVPQDPAIFNTTLIENILYANPNATDEELSHALRSSNSTDFVKSLTPSYQPGKNGSRLSGGQRQRIALCRCLLTNPGFIVLDEPTSNMDVDGEDAVKDTVQMARENRKGLVLITHRKESMALVDKVLLINEGRIIKTIERDNPNAGGQWGPEINEILPDLL